LKINQKTVKKSILILLSSVLFPIFIWGQYNTEAINQLKAELSTASADTTRVQILNNLAEEYLNTDIVQAIVYLNQAIEIAQKADYPQGLAVAYLKYGKAYYFNYKFDSTIYYYQKSLDLSQEFDDKMGIGNTEYNIGLVYHVQSDYNQAIDHYKKSLIIRNQIGDKKGSAECYNNIGAVFYDEGNYEKALDNYFSSLALSEELKDEQKVAANLANIGGIYEAQGKFDNALEYYFKGNSKAALIGDKRSMANTYRNIAGIYTQKQQFDSALFVYNQAVSISLELSDLNGLVGTYNKLGECYVMRYQSSDRTDVSGFLEKASEYYKKSLKINTSGINNKDELCKTYLGMGEVYIGKQKYTEAATYLTKARDIAIEIESPDNKMYAYKDLSIVYAGLGKYEKAYHNHLLYTNWNDSLKSDQNVEMLTQMSMQYEFDKQQKQQEFEQAQKELAYQQKLKQQRLIRTFILIGFFIVSAFTVQVMRGYQQKKRDNMLLAEQKNEIEKQKEEITDSIRYAKRIQTAILPSKEIAERILPEHFILFRPRDIVSGDYYWMNKVGSKVILVAADCTGHGVPGAFMSMLGVSFLNEIVNKNNLNEPHLILNELRAEVKKTLGQTGKEGEAKDGMDIALCVVDFDAMKLQYAGAYNPLYLFRQGELVEIKADKMPIGIYVKEKESFTNNEIQLQKGDTFYIFSDGYADQFGGPTGGKFKTKPFKELLGNIQSHSMVEQREILNTTIDEWRGEIDQVDDIIVMGVRV